MFKPRPIELVGEGALQRAFEMTKIKLEEEGLFDEARKRELPRFPQKIGIITSPDAAAYTDFMRILAPWSASEINPRISAITSSLSGAISSAACVGVAARWSATKSASETSRS